MSALESGEKRDEQGRFIVPPISPGRPKGAKNKLGEAFIEALYEDFNEHGPDVIAVVRAEKPDQYLKVIASLVPKDVNLNLTNEIEMTDDELRERVRSLAGQLAPFLAGIGATDSGVEAQASTDIAPRVH